MTLVVVNKNIGRLSSISKIVLTSFSFCLMDMNNKDFHPVI